jgi:predicted GIY-YIG superfamily endonuclease
MQLSLELYVLHLAGGYYYVGQAANAKARFAVHNLGTGAKWTQLHQPLELIETVKVTVSDPRAAMCQENWLTLRCMEQYGWQKVRGGEFLLADEAQHEKQLQFIYDTTANRIRYYIADCAYLFGPSDEWLIYILKKGHDHYHIGSTKRLGKSLGKHFAKAATGELTVERLLIVRPADGHYLDIKKKAVPATHRPIWTSQCLRGSVGCRRLTHIPQRPVGIMCPLHRFVPCVHIPAATHFFHPEPVNIQPRDAMLHKFRHIVINIRYPQGLMLFCPQGAFFTTMLAIPLHQVLREADIIKAAFQFQYIDRPDGVLRRRPFQAPLHILPDDPFHPPDKIDHAAMLSAMQALVSFQLRDDHQHPLMMQAERAAAHEVFAQRFQVDIFTDDLADVHLIAF